MFKYVSAAVIGFAALSAAGAAAADGFYVSGSVGGSYRPADDTTSSYARDPFGNSLEINGVVQPFSYANRVHYDIGVDTDEAVGYRFDFGQRGSVRTEVDIEYGNYGIGKIDIGTGVNPHDTTIYSGSAKPVGTLSDQHVNGTFNAFYDLKIFRAFTPYVGMGVGYHYGFSSSGERNRTFTYSAPASSPAGSGPTISGPPGAVVRGMNTETVSGSVSRDGAYLAEVGVAIPILDRLSIVPAYRYTNVFNEGTPVHILKVGLRYSF
ncbi:MAG: hypothetical protein WA840_11730 [Caulobacteraceae bacterium]